jgi:hypothetical protein
VEGKLLRKGSTSNFYISVSRSYLLTLANVEQKAKGQIRSVATQNFSFENLDFLSGWYPFLHGVDMFFF